jgi:lysozyme
MLIDRLKKEEGFKSHPYKDSVGLLTIGYGFNIDPSGPGLAEDESEAVLQIKVNKVKAALVLALPWTTELDGARFDVLLDMAYNLGLTGLLQFKNTLEMVKVGNYKGAAVGMLQSRWAQQVGQRALNLAKQMESGIETY